MNLNLGLEGFGKNIAEGAVKIEEDMKSTVEITVKTIADFFDDVFYQISDMTTKFVNVAEIFIILGATFLMYYGTLYPQDLWNKAVQVTTGIDYRVSSAIGGASRLLI